MRDLGAGLLAGTLLFLVVPSMATASHPEWYQPQNFYVNDPWQVWDDQDPAVNSAYVDITVYSDLSWPNTGGWVNQRDQVISKWNEESIEGSDGSVTLGHYVWLTQAAIEVDVSPMHPLSNDNVPTCPMTNPGHDGFIAFLRKVPGWPSTGMVSPETDAIHYKCPDPFDGRRVQALLAFNPQSSWFIGDGTSPGRRI